MFWKTTSDPNSSEQVEKKIIIIALTSSRERKESRSVNKQRFKGATEATASHSKVCRRAPLPKRSAKWSHCAMSVLVTSLFLAFSDADTELILF